MANSKNKSGKAKAKARKVRAATPVETEVSRRDFMKLGRNGAIGAVALGGVGFWAVSGIRATAAELDLSRLGKGKPAIVQIHDPTCAMCTALQRQTRKALKCFEEDEVIYLVASIKTNEGAAFANSYGVPHVTLMLFDGAGEVQNVLNGVRQRDELKPIFTDHVRA